MNVQTIFSNIVSMATKKPAPLDTPEVNGVEEVVDVVYYTTGLRTLTAALPLHSQIHTLLDEVERLSKIQ